MSLISADRFNTLKAKVKSECQRRAYVGEKTGSKSVSSYANSEYDYTIKPNPSTIIKQEHKNKITIPLNAINSNVVSNSSSNLIVSEQEIVTLSSFANSLTSRSKTDHSGTDCSGGCTGMCYGCIGTCYNQCSGCGSSCQTGCSNSCSGDCSGDCEGGCSGGCKGGCEGCTDSCTGNCGTCGLACSSDCSGSCASDGCVNSCRNSCSGGCYDNCADGCSGNCTGPNQRGR